MTQLTLRIPPELMDAVNKAVYWQGVKDGIAWTALAFLALMTVALVVNRK
jgi:hypothetical protein